jgi:hypothetical protein
VLLRDGLSPATPSINQGVNILAGASFLALGLVSTSVALKNWWKWRKLLKDYEDE